MVEISNVWFSRAFPLGVRNFLLNKTQKVTCVTEEVATIISYSRLFIFCAIDYFRGNQSTSLGLEKTQESERIDPKGRGARRNCCTVELVDTEGALRLKRSHSFSEETLGPRNTRESKATTIERRISAPCLTITNSLQSGTQSFLPDGMMQIENKP